MTKVVITMPAYHAADTLERTVADIPVGIADELILVDDASGDETVAVARKLNITVYVHDENRGYGGNQKTCYRRALEHGADIVVMLHPDYQYDPTAVPLLIAPLLAGRADMTFGSRFAGLSDPRGGGMPLYRYLGNRTATTLVNLMLGSRFTELHRGLRAYTRRCLLELPILRYSDDFVFDSQLMVDAVTTGQRVVEVPIQTRYTKESSSISVARSLRYVAHSLIYCGRRTATRGRRGRRSAVTFSGARQRRPSLRGRVEHTCALCGSTDAALLYPANVTGETSVSEFSCTSGGLARHDDIVRCLDCGMTSSPPTDTPERIVENYTAMVDEQYLSEEQAGWDAKGIEPSRWAVETGRRLFDVDLEQGTVETLDAEPGSRDAVVMLDVLEHLVDPLDTLRRLRGVLHGSWPWFIRPHLHYFTPETLDMMLHKAGFTMVEWRVVPRTFHASYIAGRLASSHGAAGRAAQQVTHVVDPRVPVGWLGDVVFVLARPA